VYTAGFLSKVGGVAGYTSLARWDGSSWHSLGTSLNGYTSSIAAVGSDLYVGGYFTSAGGIPAKGFARWDGSSWHSPSSETSEIDSIIVWGGDLYAGGRFTPANGPSE